MESKIMNISGFQYDAVIILSMSDWFSEMRSNRYNYAQRFSRKAPVYFVQAYDKNAKKVVAANDGNITIINPIKGYTDETLSDVFALLKAKEINNILIWIYNPYYVESLKRITVPFVAVFHATEAFLGSNFIVSPEKEFVKEYVTKIRQSINFCSFAIGVSDGVVEGIKNDPFVIAPIYTITNGCDFKFWNGFECGNRVNAVLYQGGINRKLDFSLILYLVENNSDVLFWFCGQVAIEMKSDIDKWNLILKKKNVSFFGQLHPDKVRELSHRAKVGIIPFKNLDYLADKSFPLKAFEYLASGMEVVSTHIESLQKYSEYFYFSGEYKEFDNALKAALKYSKSYPKDRIEICKQQDYDVKFAQALELVAKGKVIKNHSVNFRKRILFLYDINSCHINTIREHVNSFGLFSKNEITYYNGTRNEKIDQTIIDSFDVVVVHYSIRVSVPGFFSESIHSKLKQFNGLKILMIQDEYDTLSSTYKYMDEAEYDILFTCVPKEYHNYVYPASRFPKLKFVNNLTGYTSFNLDNFHTIPMKDRNVDVFYRGRKLPYLYGTLGVEKYEIGIKFRQKCDELNLKLNLNLDSNDSERIYGDAWYKMLSRSKAMLGTESGSNVFDFNGNLQELISKEIEDGAGYDYVFSKYIEPLEKEIKMNQISPKLFEAIALKTVLILYEGEYSGILVPNRHYIPLKKDFSNFADVVALIDNNEALEKIADTAFNEIGCNPELSYKYYIQNIFDVTVDNNVHFLKKSDVETKVDFYKIKTNHRVIPFQFFRKVKNTFVLPANSSEQYETSRFFFKQLTSLKFRMMNFCKICMFNTIYISPPFMFMIGRRIINFFK